MLTESSRRRKTQSQDSGDGEDDDDDDHGSTCSMENFSFEGNEEEESGDRSNDLIGINEEVKDAIANIRNEKIVLRCHDSMEDDSNITQQVPVGESDQSILDEQNSLSPSSSPPSSSSETLEQGQGQPEETDEETVKIKDVIITVDEETPKIREEIVVTSNVSNTVEKIGKEEESMGAPDKTDEHATSIQPMSSIEDNSNQSEKTLDTNITATTINTTTIVITNKNKTNTDTIPKKSQNNNNNVSSSSASSDKNVIPSSVKASAACDSFDSPSFKSPHTSIPVYKTKMCELCDDFTKNKPVKIKTPYVLKAFISSSSMDSYVCLSGVHLTKKGDTWSLWDGCVVTKGVLDSEWIEAIQVKNVTKISLSSFDCLYVPIVRGKGYWLVRQVSDGGGGGGDGEFSEETPPESHIEPPGIASAKEVSTEGVVEDVVFVNSSASISTDDEEEEIFTTDKEKAAASNNRKGSEQLQFIAATTGKLRGNFLNAIKKGGAIFDEFIEGNVSPALDEHADILRDEFVTVSQRHVKPLKKVVLEICNRMDSVPLSEQKRHGDDFKNVDLGWYVRDNFCTTLAEFLLIGLRGQKNVLMSLFGKQKSNTLWDIVREISLDFQLAEFDNVVKSVRECRVLLTDDARFRAFVCELLNQSTVDGKEKLIVVFFQQFPLMRQKLERFYVDDSFWRLTYSSGFGTIHEEIILSVRHFNGWPFHFHMDFERRHNNVITPRKQQQQQQQQRVKRREEDEDSLIIME